jgi:hypothetical protein
MIPPAVRPLEPTTKMPEIIIKTWSTSPSGEAEDVKLTVPDRTFTLAELVEWKAAREVEDYNRGLRKSVGFEHSPETPPPPLDPAGAAARSKDAWREQRYFVIVDGLQIDDLEGQVEVTARSRIEFVRL